MLKMLLRRCFFWHTEGGLGGVGWISMSCEVCCRKDVDTLMMLLCRRCGYLEDVVTWMIFYVEDGVTLKMLLC